MVCSGKDGLDGGGSGNAGEGVNRGEVKGKTKGFGSKLDIGRREGEIWGLDESEGRYHR